MVSRKVKNDNAAHKSKIVLLLIDVISDFSFVDGEQLFVHALPMARKISELKRRAKLAEIPCIYINDNFGNWQDDFNKTLDHCENSERGKKVVKLLKPTEDDYFVLKPKHSAFFSTTLDILLKELAAETLIITGITADICVLFTANDAYMRGYQLMIPRDCVASVTEKENEHALAYIERVLKADIKKSEEICFDKIS